MRPISILLALGLLALSCATALSAPILAIEKRHLAIEHPVPQGVPAIGVFHLRNNGDETLMIARVKAG